jgi:hypothetical protein
LFTLTGSNKCLPFLKPLTDILSFQSNLEADFSRKIRPIVYLFCRYLGTCDSSGSQFLSRKEQGCQIFLDTIYQNRKNVQNVPNGPKISQMPAKYSKWH